MLSLIKNRDYQGIAIYVLFFVMLCFQKMTSPAIGVLILATLFEILITKKLKFNFSKELLMIFGLFLFYFISISWAEHKDIGFKLLEYKLSFAIFPILFSFKREARDVWKIIEGFLIASVVLAALIWGVSNFNSVAYYTASYKILGLHPTYSSIYLSVAAFVILYGISKKKFGLSNWLLILACLFLFTTVLFLISFGAILFTILGFAFIAVRLIKIRFGSLATLLTVILTPLIIVFAVSKIPVLAYDYETIQGITKELVSKPEIFISRNKDATSGTKVRILLWYSSVQVIKENPLGVGLGDIDFYLNKKFHENDFEYLKTHDFNPHNQYLQIAIDLGVLGFVYLLIVFFFCFKLAVKHRNWILLIVLGCLCFNALFESVLQKQSGIVFFALMITLLLTERNITNEKA